MTGYDIFKRVCSLLGYDSFTQEDNDSKAIAFWYMLNQILSDLNIPQAESLSSTVNATQKQKEAIVYGGAMLFAGSLNDMALAHTFTELYNSKRNGVLCEKDLRKDVIPTPSQGGI